MASETAEWQFGQAQIVIGINKKSAVKNLIIVSRWKWIQESRPNQQSARKGQEFLSGYSHRYHNDRGRQIDIHSIGKSHLLKREDHGILSQYKK